MNQEVQLIISVSDEKEDRIKLQIKTDGSAPFILDSFATITAFICDQLNVEPEKLMSSEIGGAVKAATKEMAMQLKEKNTLDETPKP